jgi:hypothetical protein
VRNADEAAIVAGTARRKRVGVRSKDCAVREIPLNDRANAGSLNRLRGTGIIYKNRYRTELLLRAVYRLLNLFLIFQL